MAREGLPAQVTFEQAEVREQALLMNGERSRQAAGTAGAKALGWERVWCDIGTSRWDWEVLEQHEGVEWGVKLVGDGVGGVQEDPIKEGHVDCSKE